MDTRIPISQDVNLAMRQVSAQSMAVRSCLKNSRSDAGSLQVAAVAALSGHVV